MAVLFILFPFLITRPYCWLSQLNVIPGEKYEQEFEKISVLRVVA